MNLLSDYDSPNYFNRSLDDIHLSNASLKTYSRGRGRPPKLKNMLHRRKSLPIKDSAETTPQIQSILRSRSFTATPSSKTKKVTFKNPPAKMYVFERCDYEESSSNVYSDASNSGKSIQYFLLTNIRRYVSCRTSDSSTSQTFVCE